MCLVSNGTLANGQTSNVDRYSEMRVHNLNQQLRFNEDDSNPGRHFEVSQLDSEAGGRHHPCTAVGASPHHR